MKSRVLLDALSEFDNRDIADVHRRVVDRLVQMTRRRGETVDFRHALNSLAAYEGWGRDWGLKRSVMDYHHRERAYRDVNREVRRRSP